MTTRLGVQITPWSSSAELVRLGRRLGAKVDTVWVQDQMLARNVYALLGALAQAGCGVGTNVTYPIGRNPIEMASAAATVAELVPPGREVILGMGTGGALVNSLFRKDRPITAVGEAVELMRALWAGTRVELDGFPTLGAALGYKPGAIAELTYPVACPPSIVMAGVGPKILEVARTPRVLPGIEAARAVNRMMDKFSVKDLVRAGLETPSNHVRKHIVWATLDLMGDTRDAKGLFEKYEGAKEPAGKNAKECVQILEDGESKPFAWNPAALKTVLEKLKTASSSDEGGWFSTHPSAEKRIGELSDVTLADNSWSKGADIRTKRFLEQKNRIVR